MHLKIFLVYYWFNCVEIKCKLQQRVVVLFVNFMLLWGDQFSNLFIWKKKNKFNSDCSIQAGFCFVFAVFGRNGFLFCLLKSVKRHWFGSETHLYASIPVSVHVAQDFALLYAAQLSCITSIQYNQLVIDQAYWKYDGGKIFSRACLCCLSLAELWARTNHTQELRALTINNGTD